MKEEVVILADSLYHVWKLHRWKPVKSYEITEEVRAWLSVLSALAVFMVN